MPLPHSRYVITLLALSLLGGLVLTTVPRFVAEPLSDSRSARLEASKATKDLKENYGKLPLSFEANEGQTDPQVKFLSRGSGYSLFLTSNGAVLVIRDNSSDRRIADRAEGDINDAEELGFRQTKRAPSQEAAQAPTTVLRMSLVGGNREARVEAWKELPGKVNYLLGDDAAKWHTDIATYEQVRYQGVYPGIDLVYYGNQRQLEYDFVVAPAADPHTIKLNFTGAQKITADAEGNLVLETPDGEVRQRKPAIYQEVKGVRKEISGGYSIKANGEVGFKVSNYDRSKPLIIDPILSYSTLLGGAGDEVFAVAVDGSGSAYISGHSEGLNFVSTDGSVQPFFGGGFLDAVVVKLNATGTNIVYTTYIGGTGDEEAEAIAVDASGNAYVTGYTTSPNYPVTAGAFQTKGSNGDVYVTKLNTAGNGLVYSTLLGGTDYDEGASIALDTFGNAYVTGFTLSSDFPTTPGAIQSFSKGGFESFVSKLDTTGATLLYSTYIGGGGFEFGNGIAVDSSGNAYVAGQTSSRNFPVANALQPDSHGNNRGVFKSTTAGSSWNVRNSGLTASFVFSLAIDPVNPTTIYAGTEGGVAKTADGGNSWGTVLTVRSTVRALAINPRTPSTIYAGTVNGYGVFRSTDGGSSWSAINNGLGFSIPEIRSLVIDPRMPTTIYAGTRFIGSFFKSIDGGNTWVVSNTGLGNRDVFAVAIDPSNSNTLYVATRTAGVFKSTNGGSSWTAVNSGLTILRTNTLAIDPASPNTLYVGTISGIFKTTTGGDSWTATNNGLILPQTSGVGITPPSILALTIDPSNPSTVYAGPFAFTLENGVFGLTTIFKSTDGGNNWTPISNGFNGLNSSVNALAIDPSNTANIYAATTGDTEAFIAKINSTGSALLYSTYLGGSRFENATDVSIDSSGNAYVAGSTQGVDFPFTPGAFQTTVKGSKDIFVSKLNLTGSALIYSTALGGNLFEDSYGLKVDAAGNAYVMGQTDSTDFPTTPGSFQATLGGAGLNGTTYDATVTKINPSGTGLVYSSYLGGSGNEMFSSSFLSMGIYQGGNLALDAAGNAYVVGETQSFNFPTTDNAFQNFFLGAGSTGASFAAKIDGTASSFSIVGRLTDSSGAGIGGVVISLNGPSGMFRFTQTDGNGYYSFNNLASGGNYTVTPSNNSYSFSPANQTFNNLSVDRIANFVGTQTVVSISGEVADSNNAGVSNVSIVLSKNSTPVGTALTNALGDYSFGNLTAGANYVVTPAGSYTPSSQTFTTLTVNATANFKAAPSIPSQCATASFAAATNFTAGSSPESVAVGDTNGDGKLDLLVLNNLDSNVSVLLGNGAGSFGTPTNFAVATDPRSVVVGDFNGDANLDLAVTSSTGSISVLLGNGAGSFGVATNFAVGSIAESVSVGDFNGDGKLDLAVTTLNKVSVLLGNGAGGFGAPTDFSVGNFPRSVAVGDFNGDGKLDLAVANQTSNNVSVLLGNGAGGFGTATNFSVGDPFSVAVGDFNGDGKLDLATANSGRGNVSVLIGNGVGGFGAATDFSVGTAPFSVAVGDFNGDGKLDLAAANFGSGNVSVLLGNGAGGFGAPTEFSVGNFPRSVAVGHFNGDGKLDLAVANQTSNNVSILLNNATTCNLAVGLSISGRIADANNNSLPNVTVTLSGPITRVVQTDANGNYAFANLAPGGNYAVTIQGPYYVVVPSRADFSNLGSNQTADFTAAPVVVPLPTPTPSDDFNSPTRDPNRWNLGTLSQPPGAVDPQVGTAQVNGQLVITPLSQASGLHYNGYVSANSFDLTNGSASVEVVKAASGGADTIFAIGSDSDNFFRFVVHTAGGPSGVVTMVKGADGIERPLDTAVAQLIFQVKVNGVITSLSINYDPVQHRFMRFRHDPATNSIVFETSPNSDFDPISFQNAVPLTKGVNALTAELSAGTSNPANPGQTIFDNFKLVTSTFQFSSASYTVGEGDGSVLITVTRAGSTSEAASVDYATADGTAAQRTKYVNAVGTLSFTPGESSKSFSILIVDNAQAEGNETMNVLLANAVGSGLNNPGRAVLNIIDNDTTVATGNPLDDPCFFVQQQYYDFLNRAPDPEGLAYWCSQITSCPPGDQLCVNARRIRVSNAFFFEPEFQQTGSYVYRLYRAAYGNNQPFPNPDADPKYPGENLKVPSYAVFVPDRARVVGGLDLAQAQLELANAFVQRPEFLAKYPASLDGPSFITAVLNTIKNDSGADLTAQQSALVTLFSSGGRGAVMYRLADDNEQTNPINNRAFIDAEYRRAFVTTEYFGYLRRDADIGGLLFWLGQVNRFPLRDVGIQNAMVCSFITSLEYQQRFSPLTTHSNQECPQ